MNLEAIQSALSDVTSAYATQVAISDATSALGRNQKGHRVMVPTWLGPEGLRELRLGIAGNTVPTGRGAAGPGAARHRRRIRLGVAGQA
jgi:hypothetical protein